MSNNNTVDFAVKLTTFLEDAGMSPQDLLRTIDEFGREDEAVKREERASAAKDIEAAYELKGFRAVGGYSPEDNLFEFLCEDASTTLELRYYHPSEVRGADVSILESVAKLGVVWRAETCLHAHPTIRSDEYYGYPRDAIEATMLKFRQVITQLTSAHKQIIDELPAAVMPDLGIFFGIGDN